MKVEYKEIELHKESEKMIQKYQDFVEKRHASQKHDEVLRSRAYRIQTSQVPPLKSQVYTQVVGIVDDTIISTAYAGFRKVEKETNPDKIWMQISVLPEFRRKGIATEMLKQLLSFAKKHNRPSIDTGFYPIDTEAASIWTEKLNLKLGFKEKVSRLYKDKINWDFVEEKENKYKDLENRYRIERFDKKRWSTKILEDDNFAQAMVDFYNEINTLLPREDADWNDHITTISDLRERAEKNMETLDQWQSNSYYAFDGDRVIAMSGTYYPNDPPVRDIGTGLTGVRKAYQRQGLATYLKIRALKYYVENFPEFEYIYTENASVNEGMLSINYGLGFESVFEWHLYQGKVAEVEKCIKKE